MSEPTTIDTLGALAEVLEQRKHADPEKSYVASLYLEGEDKILQKVGEEAIETIIASKSGDLDQLVKETADLWFHTLVMLSYHKLGPDQVIDELQHRFGISGLKEKATRQA